MNTSSAVPQSRTLDFGRAFRFVFEDPDWVKKMLIGGGMMILGMLLIGTLWAAGYGVRLIRRTADGEQRPLPEWDDLGGMLIDGLKAAGIYLAYFFALLIPVGGIFFVLVLLGGGMAGATRGSDDAAQAVGALVGVAGMGLYAVFMVLMLLLMIYVPAAIARFALSGRFGAGFEIGQNIAFIRRNLLNYVLAIVLYFIGSFLAQFGVILCCIGVFPVSFWALCIFGWSLGETARLDPVPERLT